MSDNEVKQENVENKDNQQSQPQQDSQSVDSETKFIELKKYIDVRINEIISNISKADKVEDKQSETTTDKEIEW